MKHFSVWFGRTEAGATDPEGMGGNPNDKIKINAKIGVIILTEIILIHPQGNISSVAGSLTGEPWCCGAPLLSLLLSAPRQ